MKHTLLVALLALFFSASTHAHNSWYVTGNLGVTFKENTDKFVEDALKDDQSFMYSLAIGLPVGNYHNVEFGYAYLGESEYRLGNEKYTQDMYSFNLSASFDFKFDSVLPEELTPYGRLGLEQFYSDTKLSRYDYEDISWFAGLGMRYKLEHRLSLTGELQYRPVDSDNDSDLLNLTAGLRYLF